MRTLNTTKEKAKWLKTLLVAAFKDEAATYRFYQPRKDRGRLKKFPKSFIHLAEGLYPAFLERLGYSDAAKRDAMKRLGADLADRATAMDRGGADPPPRRRPDREAEVDEPE